MQNLSNRWRILLRDEHTSRRIILNELYPVRFSNPLKVDPLSNMVQACRVGGTHLLINL